MTQEKKRKNVQVTEEERRLRRRIDMLERHTHFLQHRCDLVESWIDQVKPRLHELRDFYDAKSLRLPSDISKYQSRFYHAFRDKGLTASIVKVEPAIPEETLSKCETEGVKHYRRVRKVYEELIEMAALCLLYFSADRIRPKLQRVGDKYSLVTWIQVIEEI